jgi:hypothetical protein
MLGHKRSHYSLLLGSICMVCLLSVVMTIPEKINLKEENLPLLMVLEVSPATLGLR